MMARTSLFSTFLFRVFILSMAILVSGCVSFPYRGESHPPPQHNGLLQKYTFFESPTLPPLSIKKKRHHENYSLTTLSLTPTIYLPHEKGPLTLAYYEPIDSNFKKPALILLPITSGDDITENLARYFVEKGLVVLRFPSRNELGLFSDKEKNLVHFQEILRDNVINIQRGLRWLKEQPEVDPHRIGIMGISMGAILASLVIEMEPSFQAAVLFLGGGNLAEIFRTSREEPIAQFRKRFLEELGSENGQQERYREIFFTEAKRILRPVEPLQYPSRLDPDRILMINGYFDGVIQRAFSQELWKHLGEPAITYLPAGHYSSVLFFYYVRYKAYKHLERFMVNSRLLESLKR